MKNKDLSAYLLHFTPNLDMVKFLLELEHIGVVEAATDRGPANGWNATHGHDTCGLGTLHHKVSLTSLLDEWPK